MLCPIALTSVLATLLLPPAPAQDDVPWDSRRKRQVSALAEDWLEARPATRFQDWDPEARADLEASAREFGRIPEGQLEEVVELLWKDVPKLGPGSKAKGKVELETPYGEAWFYTAGSGAKKPLLIGLHGGGEGAGSADEAKGNWVAKQAIAFYPQGIRLVHDTWNTVHGERFVLTMLEIAKARWQVDPDRVYTVGFSMGGTGSWFMAGRHPDLFAGAAPCAGVFMAAPQSQLATKAEVESIQHGLLPNVRNLAMYYFIGLEDTNCMPGTYLYAADRLEELRQADPGGYAKIRFESYAGLPHAFPPGEPAAALEYLFEQNRESFPEILVWEYVTDPFPQPEESEPLPRLQKQIFYWLRCENPRDHQRIRAELEGNVVRLQTKGTADGVRGLTIYLNEQMIDPAEEVVVLHGEREVYRGKPQPELWTVLETLDDKLDRTLVFDRRIDL